MRDPLIGKEIDGFRIRRVLGRGGMGTVYQAEDMALLRPVALKMIDPAHAREEAFLRRFQSEARALARIDSPHIVRIYALRRTEQGLLIVMEYIEGGTLADRLSDGPMSEEEALPLLGQMLRALSDAHGAGVIHRDVKPQNILLAAHNGVKMSDFGLARLVRPGTQATLTQGTAGTINYMSPEQVEGLSTLDHRSDLYALGMTLYEMLTGRLPFDRDSSDFVKMRTIVEEELPPPDIFRSGLPEALVKIVMKALEKKPDRRYQSAGAMQEAIRHLEVRRETERPVPESPDQRSSEQREGQAPRAPSGIGAGRPGKPPSERTTQASGRPWIWLGTLGALLVLAIGTYLFYTPTDQPTRGDENRTSIPVRVPLTLTISTRPDSATVYFNGDSVGTTPLTKPLGDGDTLRLHVQKEGFAPVDTTLRIPGGQSLRLRLTLAEIDQTEDGTPGPYFLPLEPSPLEPLPPRFQPLDHPLQDSTRI